MSDLVCTHCWMHFSKGAKCLNCGAPLQATLSQMADTATEAKPKSAAEAKPKPISRSTMRLGAVVTAGGGGIYSIAFFVHPPPTLAHVVAGIVIGVPTVILVRMMTRLPASSESALNLLRAQLAVTAVAFGAALAQKVHYSFASWIPYVCWYTLAALFTVWIRSRLQAQERAGPLQATVSHMEGAAAAEEPERNASPAKPKPQPLVAAARIALILGSMMWLVLSAWLFLFLRYFVAPETNRLFFGSAAALCLWGIGTAIALDGRARAPFYSAIGLSIVGGLLSVSLIHGSTAYGLAFVVLSALLNLFVLAIATTAVLNVR